MKRIMGLLLIVALTLGAMGGTVAEKKQVTYNEAYNATEMVSAAGEKIKLPSEDELMGDKYMGLAFIPHDLWLDMAEAGSLQAWVYSGLGISFEYVQEEYAKRARRWTRRTTRAMRYGCRKWKKSPARRCLSTASTMKSRRIRNFSKY